MTFRSTVAGPPLNVWSFAVENSQGCKIKTFLRFCTFPK